MTHKLLFFLVLLLLTGCQKEVLESTDDNRPNADGSVGFRLKTDDAVIEMDGFQTRGVPHNTLEKYDTVHVNVYSHTLDYDLSTDNDVALFREIELEQKDSKWVYTPHMFWPGTKKLSFMAYASDIAFVDAGITFTSSAVAPESITYTVPEDVTKQPDLLVSTLFNQTKVDNVFLTMKHALSSVSFCGDAPDKGVYVKKITLRNVCGAGTLALNSPTINWQLDEDSRGGTVFEAGIKKDEELQQTPPTPNYLMTETGYLMMLPQPLKDAVIDVLYWNGKDDTGNKIITYTLPINDPLYASWQPGQKYVYKFGTKSEDITVVYYEKYADKTYGLYYYKGGIQESTINDKVIEEAGYGVLSKKSIAGNVAGIRLSNPQSTAVTSGTVVKLADDAFLYPVSQSATGTFNLPASTIPQNVYFNGSAKSCGMIVPHFAKGVYPVQTPVAAHSIRTPQQMRNITQSDVSSAENTHTYTQELDLDFSKADIGGGLLTTPVVDREFKDLFHGQSKKIENVTIQALANGALFQSNSGEIKDVVLVNSSITSSGFTGGIVAVNQASGVISQPRVMGENNQDKQFKIEGTSGYVGAIAGYNYGKITGNTTIETVTGLPIAEVSGWVLIKGVSAGTGGITGQNSGAITTCLVYGVYVTDQNDVVVAKITIEGGDYVGGIAGVNFATLTGNATIIHLDSKKFPDVAGIVEISGASWVGGITGSNASVLNSMNVRLGRPQGTLKITGTGSNVGGIAGVNSGTLGGGDNTFTSVRGNVEISGHEHVGGIVGQNTGGELKNCFVHDYYTRTGNIEYFAPKITASSTNAGGIAGSNEAAITNCSVFSSMQSANPLTITAPNNAGGIVGVNQIDKNASNTECSLVGKVVIEATNTGSGGIVGVNTRTATISRCWIGNTDGLGLIENARTKLGLDITASPSFGKPTVTGHGYIGGIVGFNDRGNIKDITIADDLTIGKVTVNLYDGSYHVGGIVGGNAVSDDGNNGKVENCRIAGKKNIQGYYSIGGIVGLNNAMVSNCHVSGVDELSKPRITGVGTLGGIIGQNGSYAVLNGTGNQYTSVDGCTVEGYVAVEGSSTGYPFALQVGGIIGLNGSTLDRINNVSNCVVSGRTGSSITISVHGTTGGIVGKNSGNLRSCDVRNATVESIGGFVGGIAGLTISNALSTPEPSGSPITDTLYRSDIKDCRIYPGVTVKGLASGVVAPGALVGYINSSVVMIFGEYDKNWVSNTGVTVNGNTPTQELYIFGYNTGDGGSVKADINRTVAAVPPR